MSSFELTVYRGDAVYHQEVTEGQSLAQALSLVGISLPMPCGGRGTCGKCRVLLLQGEVTGEVPDVRGYIRACHAAICGPLTVRVAEQKGEGLTTEQGWRLPTGGVGTAVALDIGTTTMAAALVDLTTGKVVSTASCLNPQAAYGADVISRISAAEQGHLGALAAVVRKASRELIERLLSAAPGIAYPARMAVAANTTMLHLLAGVDPYGIGRHPFTPAFVEHISVSGREWDLPIDRVDLLPSVSAFIGADITAGMYAAALHRTDEATLLLDIGTNGEMVLAKGGRYLATSTAAGPALEGACFECGVGGVEGAIDHLWTEHGALRYSTIGSKPAVGLCGSGLIDAVAVALRAGFLDETGCYTPTAPPFMLDGECWYLTPEIYLSAKDIRQVQLAKSAVSAGLLTLLAEDTAHFGTPARACLAGGIGVYLSQENALRIGLLPAFLGGRLQAIGNSSLHGALLALCEPTALAVMEQMARSVQLLDLASSPRFAEEYMNQMFFEEE